MDGLDSKQTLRRLITISLGGADDVEVSSRLFEALGSPIHETHLVLCAASSLSATLPVPFKRLPASTTVTVGTWHFLLAPVPTPTSARTLAARAIGVGERSRPAARIGASIAVGGEDLARAVRHAELASRLSLRAAAREGKQALTVTFIEDHPLDHVIAPLIGDGTLDTVARGLLGPLLDGLPESMNLLITLRSLVDTQANRSRTAAATNFDRRTVLNHIRRIETRLHVDLRDPDVITSLALALRAPTVATRNASD